MARSKNDATRSRLRKGSVRPLAQDGSQRRAPMKPTHKPIRRPTAVKPVAARAMGTKQGNSTASSNAAREKVKLTQPLARRPAASTAKRGQPRWVFDASASEKQHLRDHAGFEGFCIRCDVQKRRKVYDACSWQNGSSWLATGACRGVWGLGCTARSTVLASGKKKTLADRATIKVC